MKCCLFFLLSFSLWGGSFDPLLCGKKPTASEEKVLLVEKQQIEKMMPPVWEQSPSSWCYAFNGISLLDYHHYVSQVKSGNPELFYTPKNIASPIDAVFLSREYVSKWIDDEEALRINSKEGGDLVTLLLGLQDRNYVMRSQEQISFDSLSEQNPRAVKIVEDLVAEYGEDDCGYYYKVAGVHCPSPLYKNDSFKQQVYSFKLINQWLYDTAQYNGFLKSPYEIQHFGALGDLKGDKDLSLDPFSVHFYEGSKLENFAVNLKNALYPSGNLGRPVSTSICVQDLPGYEGADCDEHAVIVVGAYYQNGQCVVRLRNSWGNDWQDQGYMTIAADQFFEMQKHYGEYQEESKKYQLIWIEPLSQESPSVHLYNDDHIFKGLYQRHYKSASTFVPKQIEGVFYDLTGSVTEVLKQQYQGGFFSGQVKDIGNGRWEPRQGKVRNLNGEMIYAYQVELSNGLIYTGSTTPKSDRTWLVKEGVARNQSGRIVEVYQYVMSDGVVFEGSVVEKDNGTLERKSGFDYRQGKMVYAYNYKLRSGEIYTGPVKDQGNGRFKKD